MRKFLISTLLAIGTYMTALAGSDEPHWITSPEQGVNDVNTWIAFRRDVDVDKVPKAAVVRIAADTKYWLWINGELALFEGGLKRGPNPRDTYYDEIDISRWLTRGKNKVAVLLWHFGKDGFSHKNSGSAGLVISSDDLKGIGTGADWLCRIHPAFGTAGEPGPNYRMPESSILFDARKDIEGWQIAALSSLDGFHSAEEKGTPGDAPWNTLHKRPIPQWKDFGVTQTEFIRTEGTRTDSITVKLPYNMQMTPVIDVTDQQGGNRLVICTDHFYGGGEPNVKAEYITKPGRQKYESLGWINGQKVIIIVPKGITVNAVGYRQTGYDSYPQGTFACNDDFYNRFWEKALRTLYVNMRDTYFDCPDRERAQWWGDVVSLMGESFYSFSTPSHALMKKAMYELVDWQKPDGVLYSPIPGNFNDELPGQMLASIGRYGFWTTT